MIKTIRIATRKSPLALWQAEFIASRLTALWPDVRTRLVPMTTSGDRFLKDKLQSLGGKGLFVKELEEALLDGRADLAVHSMKDVPAGFPEGLTLQAILERHNPFDALITRDHRPLSELPEGSLIGTTSLRRQSQLLACRPDLTIKALRGNINTRLDKLNAGDYDAIILAVAGLERMNMMDQISEIIPDTIMLPACGQGALGIECRDNDHAIQQLLDPLNDPSTALCVKAERTVNALLGGNCHVPLAVFAQIETDQLIIRARVADINGSVMIEDCVSGHPEQAQTLASTCAANLLAKGAAELLGLS